MSSSAAPPTCLVTGTGGYLGGQFRADLQARGWRVKGLVRRPTPNSGELLFQLGEPVAASSLADARALVHCAYDFKPLSWPDIHRVNVLGTEQLFRAARAAGISKLVFISSISAYAGCRSLYGRAKLEIERIAQSFGAMVVRPGFVYGETPHGLFGRLVGQVGHAKVLPLVGGGRQLQYMVHDQDLSEVVRRCVAGEIPAATEPLTIAHPQPWMFRQILEAIAQAQSRRVAFFPIPWRLLWLALSLAEGMGLRLGFRSDSLISLMHQNPNPSFTAMQSLGITCRPFAITAHMLASSITR
jgi:nucleoside-diphosphate-sugar epimerase